MIGNPCSWFLDFSHVGQRRSAIVYRTLLCASTVSTVPVQEHFLLGRVSKPKDCFAASIAVFLSAVAKISLLTAQHRNIARHPTSTHREYLTSQPQGVVRLCQ